MGERTVTNLFTSQQTGQFSNPPSFIQWFHYGDGTTISHRFPHHQMLITPGGNLWQVGHTEQLLTNGNTGKLPANHCSNRPTHTSINLVKHQYRCFAFRENLFKRQH
jgi:hypothetical protein